jgi:hypothetical protein
MFKYSSRSSISWMMTTTACLLPWICVKLLDNTAAISPEDLLYTSPCPSSMLMMAARLLSSNLLS